VVRVAKQLRCLGSCCVKAPGWFLQDCKLYLKALISEDIVVAREDLKDKKL
jgi:hypothetical protein